MGSLVKLRDLVVLAGALLACGPGRGAEVRITEIMYHPRGEDVLEYVEVHNAGAAPADISGWKFTRGIEFTFPDSTTIPAGGYLVVCKSREAIRTAYPSVPETDLIGDFAGSLANEGEQITLVSPGGDAGETFRYDDDSPWDFLADGFGASLERVCPSASAGLPENWRASRIPASPDEPGGSPGSAGGPEQCPPPPPVRPRVRITEVMYHPVLEEALEDFHEFVEIHNAGAETVDLGGWRLAGGIDFTFPAGASIAPGAYVVIARDRARLAALPAYGLAEDGILGDYARSLDNGGDKVALIGAGGQGIDSVSYDDDAPWPTSADALGAGESWLPKELLPLDDHRYLGRSLERVSVEAPSNEVANWEPSPLDGATPGKPNASARAVPLPVVADLVARPRVGEERLIRKDQEVVIEATFSPGPPSGPVELEYFVDDVMLGQNDPPTAVPMLDDGQTGGDAAAGDAIFTAMLPGRPDNSIVRYRVRADRGAGPETISPRPSDPFAWNAYFVSPVIATTTRVYHMFISPTNWGRMWTGIQGGRVTGCAPSATWDSQVPAVFVHEGRVFDVQVRYQGSRWNRMNGPPISPWTRPKPAVGPLLALSWRVNMPRYNQLEGKTALIINKLTQGCPGYNAAVGYALCAQADLPGCQTRFIRYHVNGGYYHYMLELERPGEEMMQRYHRELEEKYPSLPREEVGHLFKSMGCNCDEGPYGWGDERPLTAACGHAKEVRYQYTYERKTHEWGDPGELILLLEDLAAAKRLGTEAVRAYFEERFDLDLLLNYVAIMNWAVPFDDMFQNHFLYQRRSDGKWLLFPWDLDQDFGEWKGAQASIYMGQSGDPDNRSGWWNYVKDALLRSFRTEYEDRLFLLNNTVLHPENVHRLVDEVSALANPQEAQSAPGGFSCSFPGRAGTFKSFATQRHDIVNTKIAGVAVDAGSPQTVFVGSTVQFDASASKPDPGPDVPYEWDNGMTGEAPTFVFDTSGEYAVTLTVTVRGVPFQDSVTITVLPIPDLAFREKDGLVVMEAEHAFMNDPNGSEKCWWAEDSTAAGFMGPGYMEAKYTARTTFLSRYADVAPELRYAIVFENPGTYRVWIRGLAADSTSDSCYVGLQGEARNTKYAQQFNVDPAAFLWTGDTRSAGPQVLEIPAPGLHELSIWVRKSGILADRILLSRDQEFVPVDAGPPESALEPVDPGPGAFIRGDPDGDSKLNVTDAVAILFHAFQGSPLACEDPGDVNDDGALDITDAIALLSFLFQRGPAPPAPFPLAGHDTTPDAFPCGDT